MSDGVAPVIDGSPSSTDELQASHELVVYGQGIGSTSRIEVTTAEIRECARNLRVLEQRLRSATQSVRAAALRVAPYASLTSSGYAASSAAWQVVTDGERRAGELADLADRLDETAQRYDDTEAAIEGGVWKAVTRPTLLRPFFPWAYVSQVWASVALDAWMHGQLLPTRDGAGYGIEETLWALTGLDPAIPVVDRRLAQVIDAFVDHEVVVTRVGALSPAAAQPESPIADLEGVVAAIEDLYPDHGLVAPGTIRIDKVIAADGRVSWLVLLPGTQGELVADHGFDWASNFGAMLGDVTASTAVVVQAMRLAGIKPGEPVMIAGHSQGGLVAVNAANAVAEEMDVAGVVTVGSPTGLLDAPLGTEVLSLEHVEDLVPGLDNTANDVGDSWTTVERSLHTSADADMADLSTPGSSHDTPTYIDTAALVDASHDAALEEFFSNVESVLDPDASVDSSYYQGSRSG